MEFEVDCCGDGKAMRVQKFSGETLKGAKFSIQCATFFQYRCQKCGFQNPAAARFCAQCAEPFLDAAPIRPVTEPHDSISGERRHLTVLFCDLVGSTEIASHLDPQYWRAVALYHPPPAI